MKKHPIVVFAQVPPPEHGQSRMVAQMLRVLEDAEGAPEIHHVNARFSINMEDIGVQSLRKLLLTIRYIGECLRIRVRLHQPTLYYIPGPVKWSAVLRDWILLAVMRPWFPRLVFHWHAIGHGEWAHGSTRLRLPGPAMWDRVARGISRVLLREPSLSIAVSDNSTADARAIGSQRTCVVPNGIEDPWPAFDTTLGTTRLARYRVLANNAAEPLRILFLSRGSMEKGLLDALDACELWLEGEASHGRPLHLTLAGGMDEMTAPIARDRIESLRSRFGSQFECTVLDFVVGPEKLTCYEEADVFLAPSQWESFGLTVVEAMAAGLPVVAAASDGVSGVLPPNYPYLSPIQNPNGLAANLEKLIHQISDPDFHAFTSGLRRHFLDHYTHDKFAIGIRTALITEGLKADKQGSAPPPHGVKAENVGVKAEKRKEEVRGQESGVRGQEPGASDSSPLPQSTKHQAPSTAPQAPPSTKHQAQSTAPQALPENCKLANTPSISIYLADQNPKLGRSLGITRMTEVVMEEMQARGTMDLQAVASKSSVGAPVGMGERVLPWGTRHTVSRLLTDHLHPMLLLADRPDVWYYPKGFLPALHNICSPSVVTIHDTIVQYYVDHYPKWRSDTEYRYWAHMLRHTLTNADHVLTVSESSKRQILDFMVRHEIPEKEITVTYEPCFYESIPQPEAPEKGDYVLHLASREPHKRTSWLIDHWLESDRKDLPRLHVVGALPDGVAKKIEASDQIEKLPFLDDAELQVQFMGARALMFPSEIEGFGLPAIEAYYLGTPVCFVKGNSVEEVLAVATDHGGFHLTDPKSLDHALADVLAMPPTEIHRIGLHLRKTYARAKVVDRMVDVFEEAAAG